MPQLSKEQFLDLFHEWRDHYLARLEVELATTATDGRAAQAREQQDNVIE